MLRHYDRTGAPIDLLTFARLHDHPDYRRIALDFVGQRRISTVWLGIDHRFGRPGPPLIFETMVFDDAPHGAGSVDMERYSTEGEAIAGHAAMVKRWSGLRGALRLCRERHRARRMRVKGF